MLQMMKQRLISIDILRGLTIILMIVVNSPGTWEHVAAPLCHSAWNGLTLADTIFPCFMFIMGMTTYISLRKYNFSLSSALMLKILRRTLVLYLLGLLVNWTAAGFPGFHDLRVMGVLQRFAITYFVVSLVGVSVPLRRVPYIAGVLLVFYAVVLLAFDGYAHDESNLLSVVDRACLGNNMMNDGGIDPEGILSTIPSIAHVMIGYCVGAMALSDVALKDKLLSMTQWGIAMLFVGLLADSLLPVNKKIWSPTFVLATCGMSLLALVLLAILIDVKEMRMPKKVFLVFGMNPLVCYVLGELMYAAFYLLRIYGVPVQDYFYWGFASLIGDNMLASFVSALALTAIVGMVGAVLYAKRIFVKI